MIGMVSAIEGMYADTTSHLLLRPGSQVFQRFGGIHRFMNWDDPVLTE